MTIIYFNANSDAIAVSEQITQQHEVIGNTIKFASAVDYRALDLASELSNANYLIPNIICLLSPPKNEWVLHECTDNHSLKIYVACLAAYNHGCHHGIWIDCEQPAQDIYADIEFMLSWSPVRNIEQCEEWAIHDTDNWGDIDISEYESIEKISKMALAIAEYGDAYKCYLADNFDNEGSVEDFEDRYLGEYESASDYAYEYYQDSGMLDGIAKAIANYIDYDAIARDWQYGGNISCIKAGYESVYIFSNY